MEQCDTEITNLRSNMKADRLNQVVILTCLKDYIEEAAMKVLINSWISKASILQFA